MWGARAPYGGSWAKASALGQVRPEPSPPRDPPEASRCTPAQDTALALRGRFHKLRVPVSKRARKPDTGHLKTDTLLRIISALWLLSRERNPERTQGQTGLRSQGLPDGPGRPGFWAGVKGKLTAAEGTAGAAVLVWGEGNEAGERCGTRRRTSGCARRRFGAPPPGESRGAGKGKWGTRGGGGGIRPSTRGFGLGRRGGRHLMWRHLSPWGWGRGR